MGPAIGVGVAYSVGGSPVRSLHLSGLAAGAATIGCACQMVGFAVSSYRENRAGGLIAQGLGTEMLQIPNIVRNPRIWIPPIVAAAVLGPMGSVVSGMGASSLVGQFATIETMGVAGLPGIILLHFVLPAVLCLGISEYMRLKGWIRPGDTTIARGESRMTENLQ